MMEFDGDSAEYELLAEGIELSKNIQGIAVEIGLRLGKGMATMIEAMAINSPNKIALSIDPYGSIIYEGREGKPCRLDYTLSMRNTCIPNIFKYASDHGVRYHFIELTDKDFFDIYSDGVILYDLERTVINEYSFVHFDGPHNLKELKVEIDFFMPRTNKGGIWIFDDITPDFFDIKAIEEYMGIRVELVKMGAKKAIYRVC